MAGVASRVERFSGFSDEAIQFFLELQAEQSRAWFKAHQDDFMRVCRRPLELLMFELHERLVDVYPTLSEVEPHFFRIQRDTRFSKDKAPYKTNFGAGIGPAGKKGGHESYYFHADAGGNLLVAGGVYMPDGPQLLRIRRAIADDTRRFEAIVKAPAFRRHFGGLNDEERLKNPPRGFDCDHPAMEWLKLKRFIAWSETPASRLGGKNVASHVADECKALHPLATWLRAALDRP